MAPRELPVTGLPQLDHALGPLWRVLGRQNLVEITVVRFGELQLEFAHKPGWTVERLPEFSDRYWGTLARTLAQAENRVYDPDAEPLVSTKLPGGHRLELLVGPWAESGISCSIRVYRGLKFDLENYGVDSSTAKLLADAIARRLNVIVSGGTSSGKTTLTNSLLVHVPKSERVITVEDVRELLIEHIDNRASYIIDRWRKGGLTYDRLFDHIMRSRPDRIICGEASISNARALTSLLSTGHRGFMATIHANSALEAIESAFPDRVALAGLDVQPERMAAYLRRNIDLVIQIEKTAAGRAITELWWPGRESIPTKIGGNEHG